VKKAKDSNDGFKIKYQILTLSIANQNIQTMPIEDNINDARVNGMFLKDVKNRKKNSFVNQKSC
jgi:hypothetical protein